MSSDLIARDYPALREKALVFDRHLRELLTQHAVPLNAFANMHEFVDHDHNDT